MRRLIGLVFLMGSMGAFALDPYPRNEIIDIRHYRFNIDLNDSTDAIRGQAWITIQLKKRASEFELDLVQKNEKGAGMEVDAVHANGQTLKFTQQRNRLLIILSSPAATDSFVKIFVQYHGVPQDGLIIGKNKYGDRTFFGDNWPDRAHHWLPCIDHPSDKATVEFEITAPDHYQVIANGMKLEESSLPNNRRVTHWSETVEIPTKVMIIGAARFAVQEAGKVEGIPVESWVYPQNRDAGFSDYAPAVDALDFFYHHVGPYPYEKLANVQSTTRYGGMENASAIFYFENSITGKNDHEPIIAHEVAHQWFGNSASEKDWHHVWLSEGFATYLAHLYMEFKYGHDVLVEEIKADRQRIFDYSKSRESPIIDTLVTQLTDLLNPNSYEKGSWVLHMLRREVGDVNFWNGLRTYYQTYRDGNALTEDFQQVMEAASQKDLSIFFNQWLWRAGHPRLSIHWSYQAARKQVELTIDQLQEGLIFQVPLDIAYRSSGGDWAMETVRLDSRSQKFSFPAKSKPQEIVLDPLTWLLFESEIVRR